MTVIDINKKKGELGPNLVKDVRLAAKEYKVRVEGIKPLIMKHPRTADPTCPEARALGALTSLKGKQRTLEVLSKISALEWEYALYTDGNGTVVLPTLWFWRSLCEGAKATRQGQQMTFGMRIVEEFVPFTHDGPNTVAELRNSPRNFFRTTLGNMDKRVAKTRPIFFDWSTEFTINVDPDAVNPKDVLTALQTAGFRKGVGDGRGGAFASIFGLYKVTHFQEVGE
jgi:hypothetical protein